MLYRNDWLCEGLTPHYVIVAAMRARTPSRSFTFGGSGGINVGSGCLDGPGVHRSADSTWSEPSVDRRVKPTDAEGERVRTASRVPGGARPGRRTGVPCRRRRTGVNTPSQSEGEHLTGGRAPTQSQDWRVTETGGTLGQSCPTEERARRGRTPNTQDRARRRAVNHRKQTERVCELGGAAHKLPRKHSQGKQPHGVSGMATLWTSVCTTFVAGEGGRSVRLGVSTVSLMSVV